MTNEVDPDRHLSVFDPLVWGARRISIVGCGATGSHLAPEAARLGIQHLDLWDFDTVASENIANQLYPLAAIGRPKAATLADLIRAGTGLECRTFGKCEGPLVDPAEDMGDVVFLCLDSFGARREVLNNRLRGNPNVQLVIDTRIGIDEIRLYTFCPLRHLECRAYETTLVDDSESAENACQTKTTIGAMACLASGFALKAMLYWYRREIVRDRACQRPLPFEILTMTNPFMIMTR